MMAETGVPIAELAAMREVLNYPRDEVDDRDRWTDSRAGGYAAMR